LSVAPALSNYFNAPQLRGYAPVQIELVQDQTVRWLVIGMGTENDLHTPIFFNQVRVLICCCNAHDALTVSLHAQYSLVHCGQMRFCVAFSIELVQGTSL
jgi:hypothetical protein